MGKKSDAPMLGLRKNSPYWLSQAFHRRSYICPVMACQEENPPVCPIDSRHGVYKDRTGCECPCCLSDRTHACLSHEQLMLTEHGADIVAATAERIAVLPDDESKAATSLRAASDFRKYIGGMMERKPFQFPDQAGVKPRDANDHAEHQQALLFHAQEDTRAFNKVLESHAFPSVPLKVVPAVPVLPGAKP